MKKIIPILLIILLTGCSGNSNKELVFLSHSDFVYHTTDCKLVENADQSDLRIIKNLKSTVFDGQRPCKECKPIDNFTLAETTMQELTTEYDDILRLNDELLKNHELEIAGENYASKYKDELNKGRASYTMVSGPFDTEYDELDESSKGHYLMFVVHTSKPELNDFTQEQLDRVEELDIKVLVEEGYKELNAEVNEIRARLDLMDEWMSIVREYIGSR